MRELLVQCTSMAFSGLFACAMASVPAKARGAAPRILPFLVEPISGSRWPAAFMVAWGAEIESGVHVHALARPYLKPARALWLQHSLRLRRNRLATAGRFRPHRNHRNTDKFANGAEFNQEANDGEHSIGFGAPEPPPARLFAVAIFEPDL